MPDTIRFVHTYRRAGLRHAADQFWVKLHPPVWLGGIDGWSRCRKYKRRIDHICLSGPEIRVGRRDLIEQMDSLVRQLQQREK